MKTFGFQWHLTNRCNGRCRHCYQTDYRSDSECDFEQIKVLANKIFHYCTQRRIAINLTGGEPFLLPYLDKLIAYLHGFDNLDELQIITNATICNQKLLQSLVDFPKLRTIKISLESADPIINDKIRGAGNFRSVRANIELYKQWSRKSIVLMTTLSRTNLGTIEKTISFAMHAQLDGVMFERFIPLGHGMNMKPAVLGPQEWALALETLNRLTNPSGDADALLPYHAFYLSTQPASDPVLKGALCNLGAGSMALMPDATVYPCRRLPVHVGNLLSESFAAISKRLEHYAQDNLSSRLIGSLCGMCGIDSCMGCRAMAFAMTGNPYLDDPTCPLLFEKS